MSQMTRKQQSNYEEIPKSTLFFQPFCSVYCKTLDIKYQNQRTCEVNKRLMEICILQNLHPEAKFRLIDFFQLLQFQQNLTSSQGSLIFILMEKCKSIQLAINLISVIAIQEVLYQLNRNYIFFSKQEVPYKVLYLQEFYEKNTRIIGFLNAQILEGSKEPSPFCHDR